MGRIVALAVVALLSSSACATPHPRTPVEVTTKAAQKKAHSPLDDLGLTPDQRERADAIVRELREEFADYDRERIVLVAAIAEHVSAGTLDREALKPLAEAAIRELERAMPAALQAMEDMHALLDDDQRTKLVRRFRDGRKRTEEEERVAQEGKIEEVLDLTGGQKARLYPSLLTVYVSNWGVIRDLRAAMDEALDEFESDDLDTHTLALAGDLHLMALAEAAYEAMDRLVAALTHEQRQTLAALLQASISRR